MIERIPQQFQRRTIATFLASTISSGAGLSLLQRDCSKIVQPHAGRTIDLTIFAAIRALDVLVGTLWQRHKTRRIRDGKFTKVEGLLGYMTDATVFAVSSGWIMYTWVYTPDKLPRSYRKWITDIADADMRVVEALRKIKTNEFVYGKDTGQKELLGSYCRDLDLPELLGDPAVTVPIPCQVSCA